MVTSQGWEQARLQGAAVSSVHKGHRTLQSKPCMERSLKSLLLPSSEQTLWTIGSVRTWMASSKDTQRLVLQASSPQLLKGAHALGLVMMALELLGQGGELLLLQLTAPPVAHFGLSSLFSVLF